MLFVLLCYDGGKITITQSVLDKVPVDWTKMLEVQQMGIGMYRLQIKPLARKDLSLVLSGMN